MAPKVKKVPKALVQKRNPTYRKLGTALLKLRVDGRVRRQTGYNLASPFEPLKFGKRCVPENDPRAVVVRY